MSDIPHANRLTAWPFVITVGLTALAAGLGGIFLPGEWYAALAKPAWTPPNWIFAPVWFALYVAIAVAGRLIWRYPDAGAARTAWLAQIVFVGAWSGLFFGLKQPGIALIDIVLLLTAIIAFIALAWRHSRAASWLFVPYLAWVSYATALNAAIWSLNP